MTPSSAERLEPAAPASWTREEAIGRLRTALVALCGSERSLCRLAAEQAIFCRGFRQWPAHEFHRRFRPFIGVSTHLTRPQMEAYADLWQMSEQMRLGVVVACDVAPLSPGACRGWDEFSNADLERHCREVLGRDVAVGTQEAQGEHRERGAGALSDIIPQTPLDKSMSRE